MRRWRLVQTIRFYSGAVLHDSQNPEKGIPPSPTTNNVGAPEEREKALCHFMRRQQLRKNGAFTCE
jgi:hypothetical protein